ncbi:hypothetical protein FRC04_002039 [Tulasnella sp. 424]|nr:hypothetical protein FRC04_002039 [Tulasnella sp. 424]KAG8968245.1 hypothetical protein FRC05_001626 [Tulasnella sp. 425]
MDVLTEGPPTAMIIKGPIEVEQPANLQDLPVELLKQIISDLPFFDIPNFMVNRYLRSICEQCLYKTIILWAQPQRTIHLLETFILRPDLALLVYHLHIDVSWVNRWGIQFVKEVPEVLKPDGAEALSLAKNIRSLRVDDIGNWMHAPEYARIHSVVSSMKLARLSISLIDDPTGGSEDYAASIPEGWDRKAVTEIRTVLQAQPLLEELRIEH